MASKENMTFRIEPELKEQASALFRALGMDTSTAIGIFFRQALRCNGMPFEIKLTEPNETTYAAMAEGERLLKDPNTRKFSSVDELFEDLDA